MRTRSITEEKNQLIQGALQHIQPNDRLIWFHTGLNYTDLPKGVPYLVEYVNGGEISYIETTRLDTLEPFPLSPFHLVTTGISKKPDGGFEVTRSNLPECVQAVLEGRLATNFCAVPISDMEQYIKERRDILIKKLSATMEEMNRLVQMIRTYERRAGNFSEDRGFCFRKVFSFS